MCCFTEDKIDVAVVDVAAAADNAVAEQAAAILFAPAIISLALRAPS